MSLAKAYKSPQRFKEGKIKLLFLHDGMAKLYSGRVNGTINTDIPVIK